MTSAALTLLSLVVNTALSGQAVARAENTATAMSPPLRGHVHDDQFLRVYEEAKRALKERRYDAARGFAKVAIKEAQSPGQRSKRMLEADLILAMIEVRTEEARKANALLTSLDRDMSRVFGEESIERATQLSELAETELELFKFKQAELHAQEALRILDKLSQQTEVGGRAEYANERGQAQCRLGKALASQGFHQEAKPHFVDAHELLNQSPGFKDQDLADELRTEAIFLRGIGQKKEALVLFDKSCQLQDRLANPEQPQHLTGTVIMRWEPGSPRCCEIIDNDFPLRYITTNKVRVACTTFDLWELMAVMVCVTNLDDHRRMVGFGDIKLYKVEADKQTGMVKQISLIPRVDHRIVDPTRREMTMWSLTQDRPWLANMQKNRNVRGLVPNEGHDLFRGPNMFGVWCEWGGTTHVVPTKVSVLPSRENVFSHEESDDLNHESGLIRREGIKQAGLMPIALEPYESRTGELFYIYPRSDDTVSVHVNIGNTIFEFPFQCHKRRGR